MRGCVLSVKNVVKTYPGVVALNNVSIDFYEGEIHALVGENGAGKSTLVRIVAGAERPDSGYIVFDDNIPHKFLTPLQSRQYGVEVVYQELNLIGSLSVAENICFGERKGVFVNWRSLNRTAEEALSLFGVNIEPMSSIYELPTSKQQIVEILKAVFRKARILILDEPTASLTGAEVNKLFEVLRKLKERGVCIIYISHRLDEVFEIADRVTVLRDGNHITTLFIKETSKEELINHMVGRKLSERFHTKPSPLDEVVLKVEGLSGNGFKDVSFELRKGEILGFAGLVGAGRTEIVRALYGADKKTKGKIYIEGKLAYIGSPKDAVKLGIGMIPEDRKKEGCLLTRSVRSNITSSVLKRLSRAGFVSFKKELSVAKAFVEKLRIKTPTLEQEVRKLSGGNQQKVVIARVLATDSKIVIFDEPTRGIDVGAKREIYELMMEIVKEGRSLLMISSEMEELIGLCDRIIVIREGTVAGILERSEFNQEKILRLAMGKHKQ